MPALRGADRCVVTVRTSDGGATFEVVSTPTGFQGITSTRYSVNERLMGFLIHENGEDWETYGGDEAANHLEITSLTGTVTLARPSDANIYQSSNSDTRISLGTGTHTLVIGNGWSNLVRVLRETNPTWKTFTSADATPSVADFRHFKTAGSTNITAFDDMPTGGLWRVYWGGTDITIEDGANIACAGNANVTLTERNPVAIFIEDSGVARMVNNVGLELASTAETSAGTNDTKAITPLKLDERLTTLPNAKTATELTIAAGAITPTLASHSVDTESDAATDDLDTITATNFQAGDTLRLFAAHTDRTVVVKHGTGNIQTETGEDYSLDDAVKTAALRYDGTNWNLVSGGRAVASSSDIDTGTDNVKTVTPLGLSGALTELPNTNDTTTLTISSGAVTATLATHVIASESDTTDTLETFTMTGFKNGATVRVKADSGDTITIDNGGGNITTNTGEDLTLTGSDYATFTKTASGVDVYVSASGFDGTTYSADTTFSVASIAELRTTLETVAGATVIGDHYAIIDLPAGVLTIDKQIVLPNHNWRFVSVSADRANPSSDDIVITSDSDLTDLSLSSGQTYDLELSVSTQLTVGQVVGLEVSGGSGNQYILNGAGVVSAVSGSGPYDTTIQLELEVAPDFSTSLGGATLTVYPMPTTLNFTGTGDIIDYDNLQQVISNRLFNASAYADDPGAIHHATQSNWDFFRIGIDFNLSSHPAGTSQEQDHGFRNEYGGFLSIRGCAVTYPRKGCVFGTTNSTTIIYNSFFNGANQSGNSADGIYCQLGAYIQANDCLVNGVDGTGIRAREGGRIDAQSCKSHGNKIGIGAEDRGFAFASGSYDGNATYALRCSSDAFIRPVVTSTYTDSPTAWFIDGGLVCDMSYVASTTRVVSDSGADVVVSNGGEFRISDPENLSVDGDGWDLTGSLTLGANNVWVNGVPAASLDNNTLYEVWFIPDSATDAADGKAYFAFAKAYKLGGGLYFTGTIDNAIFTLQTASNHIQIAGNSTSEGETCRYYVKKLGRLL